jgi:hypothetical protein
MGVSEELGRFIAGIIETIKTESFEWEKNHQTEMLQLKEEKAIAEKRIQEQIEEMEVRFKGYKKRLEMGEEHQTRQFGQFLDSIDEIKDKILQQYAQMPRPIGLMIHHHAAELLKEAWHNPDARERLKKQNRFTELMLAVSNDLADLGGNNPKLLPEKTLKLISDSNQQY